jgi:hypothetical protein
LIQRGAIWAEVRQLIAGSPKTPNAFQLKKTDFWAGLKVQRRAIPLGSISTVVLPFVDLLTSKYL